MVICRSFDKGNIILKIIKSKSEHRTFEKAVLQACSALLQKHICIHSFMTICYRVCLYFTCHEFIKAPKQFA